MNIEFTINITFTFLKLVSIKIAIDKADITNVNPKNMDKA